MLAVEWVKPKFSKKDVNRAGRLLCRDEIEISAEYFRALDAINNWRASHSFPLNTFQTTLRKYSRQFDTDCVIAQRIKRFASIYGKLTRYPTMTLSQMQDIGGCRAILSDVEAVYALRQRYTGSNIKHSLQRTDDYIAQPKPSGYRGLHMIYRYNSDRIKDYNGLLIEIQIRSQMQHIWATSVETVGAFVKQALKSSHGEEDWLKFFALMGGAIAIMENAPPVPGITEDTNELTNQVREYQTRLDVISRLGAYNLALEEIDTRGAEHHFYLLLLDAQAREVKVSGFKASESEAANEAYSKAEQELRDNKFADAVLVSVDSIASLKKAYPNYFLDTSLFGDVVRDIVDVGL